MKPRDLGLWRWLLDSGLLALALFTLAGFAAGLDWTCELLCHFRIQYAVVGGLWLLFALWATDLRRVAVAAAVVVVNLALILPLYVPGAPPAEGHRFRLLLSNINFSNRHPERLTELVKAEDPDLVLVTELAEPAAEAMEPLANAYPFQILKTDDGARSVGIYSRRPLTDARLERIGGVGWVSAIATANVDGRMITIVACHPRAPGGREELVMRNEQLAAMGQWATQQTGPLVIAGDLNTTSWSPGWRTLVQPAGLVDTRQGYGPQCTWPSFSKVFYIPLDHVLVRGVGVVSREVAPDVGSDHRPVVVELVVE